MRSRYCSGDCHSLKVNAIYEERKRHRKVLRVAIIITIALIGWFGESVHWAARAEQEFRDAIKLEDGR